jgi:competence protein ComEC
VAALALGLAASPAGGRAVAAAAAFAALPLCAAARDQRARALAPLGALAGLLVLGGGLAGQARLAAIDAPAARVQDGRELAASVFALGRPRPSAFGSSVEVEVAAGPLRGARLLVRVPRWGRWPASVSIGEVVSLRGRMRRLNGSGRATRLAAYLRRRGIAGELLLDRAKATSGRRRGLGGAIDRMRERSERAIRVGMRSADAELMRGMVLGQDEAIAEPVRDSFRASGLAHLLAVSGQNVMLLVALALPALSLAGLGIRGRCGALLGLIAIYVPLAGAGPSLQRAGVMGAAGIVALASSRPASRTYALLLAAAATLALNPRAAGDPGWQLSFVAVAGIVWVVPPLQRVLRRALEPPGSPGRGRGGLPLRHGRARSALPSRLWWRLLQGLAEGAALTLVATVATAPLLAHHFGSAPLAGVPANLLALPAVAPAMWLGMLQAAVGQAAIVAEPVAGAGQASAAALGALGGPPVAYIAWLADRFGELPGGQLELPLRSPLALAGSYALLAAGVAALRRVALSCGPRAEAAVARWRRLSFGIRAAVMALAVAAVTLAAVGVLSAPPPPQRLTARFLDVGQGDGTLIQHPDGSALLFDGGPPEAPTVRMLRQAGVRKLALVVATHASRDHHGGLIEVLRRFPVGLLLDGGDGTREPDFRRLLTEASSRGVRRIPAVAPLTLRAGSLSVRVLSPPPRPPGPPPEDPNRRGVVAVVSAGGFEMLLSADAESDALLPLPLPDVDAIKVPHHGSSDPGLPELLRRLRPEVAGIEVGQGNSYGHPAPSTLVALRTAGVRTYRTDRDGTVSLTVGPHALAVTTER